MLCCAALLIILWSIQSPCVLQAGLAVCLSALQSASCPGTAVFAHLWSPVCAALLLTPQDQYIDLQGQALQQHQSPGIVQMLPVLHQMAELQSRVTQAAAELVATALQVSLSLPRKVSGCLASGSTLPSTQAAPGNNCTPCFVQAAPSFSS